MKVIIILSAYNEQTTLPALLATFQGCVESNQPRCRIVILDDGSTDETGTTLRSGKAERPPGVEGRGEEK